MSCQARRRQVWFAGLLGAGLLAAASAAQALTGAETTDRAKESASVDAASIEKKLDQILANQQAILSRFDAVMEELRIIKVRATR